MQDTRKEQLLKFCQSLGIEMHKLELLNSALTHTSYAHESKELPRPEHNERVEFLGDSVLSVIVSTYMYEVGVPLKAPFFSPPEISPPFPKKKGGKIPVRNTKSEIIIQIPQLAEGQYWLSVTTQAGANTAW